MRPRDHSQILTLIALASVTMLLAACASTVTGPPPDLSGTRWAVTRLDGSSTGGRGADLTADFGVDGRINGDSGCNSYSGPYIQKGSTVQIGELLSTRRACTDDDRQQQEARMLRLLEDVTTVERAGDGRISLRGETGSVLLTPLSTQVVIRDGRTMLDCDGIALTVVYQGDTAALTWSAGHDVLTRRSSPSGTWYESSNNTLRGAEAPVWTQNGRAPRTCETLR
jgi:heat shock protein HslJ